MTDKQSSTISTRWEAWQRSPWSLVAVVVAMVAGFTIWEVATGGSAGDGAVSGLIVAAIVVAIYAVAGVVRWGIARKQ